jgi:hypothetical protein
MSKQKVKSTSSTTIKNLKTNYRLSTVEQKLAQVERHYESSVEFDASVLFGLNGLVNALIDKGVITQEDLNIGRNNAIEEYKKTQKIKEWYESNPSVEDKISGKWCFTDMQGNKSELYEDQGKCDQAKVAYARQLHENVEKVA